MKHITRDIDPIEAQDLLERVPRACLAYADDNGPYALPMAFAWRNGRYFVGLTAPIELHADQEVVVLIDEGVHFFDLRAIYIRGRIQPATAPLGADTNRRWFEVIPTKIVAWDYGTLREVNDAG